jgi:hypothetical protein
MQPACELIQDGSILFALSSRGRSVLLAEEGCVYRHVISSMEGRPQSEGADIVREVLGEDVLRERERAYSVEPGAEHPIVLHDLRKVFPPQDSNPAKVAVSNLSATVARGECFGCARNSSSPWCTIFSPRCLPHVTCAAQSHALFRLF